MINQKGENEMNKLDYKIGKLYFDTPIWSMANRRYYTQMFEYYLLNPTVNRDAISWLDYLEGNKN